MYLKVVLVRICVSLSIRECVEERKGHGAVTKTLIVPGLPKQVIDVSSMVLLSISLPITDSGSSHLGMGVIFIT